MKNNTLRFTRKLLILFCLLSLLLTSGCASLSSKKAEGDEGAASARPVAQNPPYYPTNFKDLLIPGELKLENEKTMSITTASFAGGIIVFSGRVEMNSLSDFFASTMQKNGWKLMGTVKHKEILLAFIKRNKTCMLRITKSDFGMSTDVYAYITEDISAQSGM